MGWSCCNAHGGRAKCPANSPTMCGRPFCAAGGSDYCCYTEDGCKDYGGTRPCVEPGRSLYTNNCKDLCLILTLLVMTIYLDIDISSHIVPTFQACEDISNDCEEQKGQCQLSCKGCTIPGDYFPK